MIYLHKNLKEKGYSSYQIQRLVDQGKLFAVKDVYSTTSEFNYLEYISKKHPNAILSLCTACYCYGLVKENHLPYVVVTKQKDRKILDDNVKQIFMRDDLYPIGINNIKFQNVFLTTYDLERLLIEVVRNKVNMDYDIYQEIVKSYRKILKLINIKKLNNYLPYFKDKKIVERISNEVLNYK